MSFFNRKRIEDEEESLEERTVKIKDLKKENRRRRVTPAKPWGRKERFLVAFILLASVIGSISLALVARRGKLPGLPRVGSSSGFALSETVILENNTPAPQQKKAEDIVSANFNSAVSSLSGLYALSVVDLVHGTSFGISDNEVMQAASLIKLPVFIAAYSEAEAGRLSLDSKYTLRDADKIDGSGFLRNKPAGTVLTYRDLLSYMGQQSDNTAFHVMVNKLGKDTINKYIDSMGMKNTSIDENTTTPAEIAGLLKKLYDGSLISKKNRDEMLGFLTNTIYEDHLVKGVPEDIRVAHKYGREVHVVNDAGIVFGETPYVVVIMTAGVVETEADNVFPSLSKVVYEGMEGL